MKKYLLTSIVLFFIINNVSSQTLSFCNAWSFTNGGQVFGSAIDLSGNIYVAGHCYASTIIGTDTLISNGGDIIIVKFNSSGTPIWAKVTDGTGQGTAYSIDVDKWGNVFITGEMANGTVIFDSTHILTSTDKSFLVKYDSTGVVLWAKGVKAVGGVEAKEVSIDSSGNPFITGWFQSDTAYFDNYWITNTINSLHRETFVAKYDSAGNALWARSVRGSSVEECESVKADSYGNAYICGQSASDTLIAGTDTLFGAIGFMFVIKYDANGNALWARNAGGLPASIQVYSITSDQFSNVYVTGYLNAGTLIFGNDTLLNSGTYSDALLLKYDSIGNEIWARNSIGIGGAVGTGVCADTQNNIYLTGVFSNGNIDFGNYSLNYAGVFTDIFLVKYDSSGNVLWAKSAGGLNRDQSWTVRVGNQNDIYIAGDYRNDTLSFDGILLNGFSYNKCYVAKICGTTGIEEISQLNSVNIFPNPAASFITIAFDKIINNGVIEIYNILGENVLRENIYHTSKKEINVEAIANGIYLLKFFDGEKNYCKKIVVEHN